MVYNGNTFVRGIADLSIEGFWLMVVISITSENEMRNFWSSDVILFVEEIIACFIT